MLIGNRSTLHVLYTDDAHYVLHTIWLTFSSVLLQYSFMVATGDDTCNGSWWVVLLNWEFLMEYERESHCTLVMSYLLQLYCWCTCHCSALCNLWCQTNSWVTLVQLICRQTLTSCSFGDDMSCNVIPVSEAVLFHCVQQQDLLNGSPIIH